MVSTLDTRSTLYSDPWGNAGRCAAAWRAHARSTSPLLVTCFILSTSSCEDGESGERRSPLPAPRSPLTPPTRHIPSAVRLKLMHLFLWGERVAAKLPVLTTFVLSRSSRGAGFRWGGRVAALPAHPTHGARHPTQKHPESVGGDEQIWLFCGVNGSLRSTLTPPMVTPPRSSPTFRPRCG